MDIRDSFQINNLAGGSTLTRGGRDSHLSHFDATMRSKLNCQFKLGSLSTAQAARYFAHERDRGISTRTLQNRAASLRAALAAAGRGHFAQTVMTNDKLGISGASRAGTHRPASPGTTAARVATLTGGHAAAAGLQRTLGLRAQEAVQSGGSLASWAHALSSGRTSISVSHGTKGGRARTVHLSKSGAQKALAAVRQAQAVAKGQGGRLIRSKTLEGANRSYQRSMNAAGFKGAEASHSLRCAWAQERYAEYVADGVEEREALSLLSQDLGHGDGRGRYVRMVYLRGQEQEGD